MLTILSTAPGWFLASIPSPSFQELTIGPFSFRLYGLMIALGVVAAVWIARRRWSSYGGDPEDITSMALVAVPAGLIGARLYHVITDWPDRYSDGRWWPDAFMIWKGGLGIPGGVLLGAIAAIVVARYLQLDWRNVGDAAAPAVPVAQAIGRLGNWFNQELYGRATDLPWGLKIDGKPGTYHPTFLYELLWNLGLAGLIVWGSARLVLRRGRWFAVYVLGYGLGRLWVEALRDDFANKILGLRVNIWTALLAIVGGTVWLFWRGNPIDREATERLRAGATMAEIMGVQPSPRTHPELAEALAAAEADEAEAGQAYATERAAAGRTAVATDPDAGPGAGGPDDGPEDAADQAGSGASDPSDAAGDPSDDAPVDTDEP